MAQITEEKLNEARAFIEQRKFDEFMAWLKVNVPTGLDLEKAGPTFKRCFDAQDLGRARKLFEVAVKDYDPEVQFWAQLTVAAFRLSWGLLKLLAVIGGCAYLFKVACG